MKRRHCTPIAVVLLIAISTLSLAIGNSAENSYLVSDHEWSEQSKVWLARAMVSEAGWKNTSDHIAIAYVLLRRWKLAQKRYAKFPLVSVIRKYCAGFRGVEFTARQKWIKNLTADAARPVHWPNDIYWSDYRERWLAVLDTAEQWRQGQYADPCAGKAMYWGGPLDHPSKRMIKMDCGETKNFYYTVRPLLSAEERTSEALRLD